MSKRDLISDALADAKALRENALQNAKEVIEEEFTPHLKSMIAQKLRQVDEGDYEDEEEMDEEAYVDDGKDGTPASELDEEDEAPEKLPEEEPEEVEVEEDLDLEAVIRELEAAIAGQEISEEEGEEEEVPEEPEEEVEEGRGVTQEDIANYLSEILVELDGDESIVSEKEYVDEAQDLDETKDLEEKKELEEKNAKLEEELEEAYTAVKTLKDKLMEVNLLNSKLLYSTKVFKKFDLNESQKTTILEGFDRATSVREVKLLFVALCESYSSLQITKRKKASLREALNRSKTTRSTAPRREVIQEGRSFVQRLQHLANIKKD